MKIEKIEKGKWYLIEYIIRRKKVKVIYIDYENKVVYARNGLFGRIKDEQPHNFEYELKRISFWDRLGL